MCETSVKKELMGNPNNCSCSRCVKKELIVVLVAFELRLNE